MLAEKYRPRQLNEIIGQKEQAMQLRRWAESWKNDVPSYRSAFLYGPPGVGKSSAVYAVANEFGFDILEIAIGDEIKTFDEFKQFFENAIYTSPYKNKCLIIFEEFDSFEARHKRYIRFVEDCVEKSINPIIFTLNDEYSIRRVTTYFKNNSLFINFGKLKDYQLRLIAERIMKQENIQQPHLDDLISYAHGDSRYVLNNLSLIEIVPKNTTDIIFNIVHDVFRGEWDGDTSQVDLEFIWWGVRQNIENFYSDIHGMTVQQFLAEVDMIFAHRKRLMSRDPRYAFRLNRYIVSMLRSLPMHQKTARIMISKSPLSKGMKPDIQNFASSVHCSYRKAVSEFDPRLVAIWKKAPRVKIIDTEILPDKPKEKSIFDYAQ